MKKLLLLLGLIGFLNVANAQILAPVKWSFAAKKINSKEAILFFKATIDEGWHIYSQTVKEGGPIKTDIKVKPGKGFTLVGKPAEPKPVTKFEKAFKMNVSYFENEVIFQQKVKLTAGTATVKGQIEYMTCNDRQCLPPDDVDFSIAVK